MEFINESNLEFEDISSEASRIYTFPNSQSIKILNPLKINISASGGHRIFDSEGKSHYIPSGWIHLMWVANPGKPNFVK